MNEGAAVRGDDEDKDALLEKLLHPRHHDVDEVDHNDDNRLYADYFRDAGAVAAAADDEDEEALPEEEENRPILPYSSFFILSSTNP